MVLILVRWGFGFKYSELFLFIIHCQLTSFYYVCENLIIMMLEQLELKVLDWADEKGILKNGTKLKQGLKTLSEVEELLTAIADSDAYEIKDAIGDIVVTLIIQADMNGLTLTECVESAYNVIKNRKGQMVNGTFVKEV